MTTGESPQSGRGKSPLVVLFLIVVIDLIGFGIVLPLLPRYSDEYHATPLMNGVLMASFSAMQFVFAPFWGRISDRRGRRPILMVGLFGSILSYTLFGFARSYEVLLFSRLAAGFFGATIGAAQAYIADVTTQKERGRGMALIGAAFGIGFTIGPAIGGFAAGARIVHVDEPGAVAHSQWMETLSNGLPGFIAATLSVVAFLLAWRLLPEPHQHRERAERKLFDTTALRHALATRTVPLILTLQFVATFAFASFETTLSLLTKNQWKYDERHNGLVFTFIGLVLVLTQGGIVRRYMSKVGETNFTVLGSLLMAIGLFGVAVVGTPAMLYVALAVAVIGFAMVTPSLSSLLSRRTPAEHQGEVLGLGQSMLSLARVLGPLWGNLLFGVAWTLPHIAAANLLLLAFLLALVLRRTPAADAESPPHLG